MNPSLTRCAFLEGAAATALVGPFSRTARALHEQGFVTDPALRRMDATCVKPGEYELYDLRENPFERNNLAGQERIARIEKRLREALLQWRKETDDPLLDPEELRSLTEKHDRLPAAREQAIRQAEAEGAPLPERRRRALRNINFDYRRAPATRSK